MPDLQTALEESVQAYLALSEEMLKFLKEDDVDRFLDLERQRAVIFARMEEQGLEAFKTTEAGQTLLERLNPIEMQPIYSTKVWLNKARTQNDTVRSYEVRGFNPSGHLLNREL